MSVKHRKSVFRFWKIFHYLQTIPKSDPKQWKIKIPFFFSKHKKTCLLATSIVSFRQQSSHHKSRGKKSGSRQDTMVDNSQKCRLQYWATRSSVHSFARTAHSLARSLTSRTPLHSLAPSLAHFVAQGPIGPSMRSLANI